MFRDAARFPPSDALRGDRSPHRTVSTARCSQYLAHKGYVQVDWSRVGNAVTDALVSSPSSRGSGSPSPDPQPSFPPLLLASQDADGDGKLTHKDLVSELKQLVRFASYRMPWAAAFSAGFAVGFRWVRSRALVGRGEGG